MNCNGYRRGMGFGGARKFVLDLSSRKEGFTQIGADQGADERRFLVEESIVGWFLEES